MYVVVFHGHDAVGYAVTETKDDAQSLLKLSAKSNFFTLSPLKGYAMTILSDDGTYSLPFQQAKEIVIVKDLDSLRLY